MAVIDWDQKKVTATLSIVEDPPLDHVLQISCPLAKQAFLLYNGKTDFLDSEITAYTKDADTLTNRDTQEKSFVLRSDLALDNAYVVGIHDTAVATRKVYIQKFDAGVLSTLHASGSIGAQTVAWERWRVRCWDVAFPANLVRFTVEKWDGANWILQYQVDEASAFLLATPGRSGIGAYATNVVVPNYKVRFNDVDLGHMV